MHNCSFSYENVTSEEYLSAVYGIAALGTKQPKQQSVRSCCCLRSRAKRAWIFFAVAFVLLDLELLIMKMLHIAPTMQVIITICMVVTFFFGCLNFMLWLRLRKSFRQLLERTLSSGFTMGEITIDEGGITDCMDNGAINKYPWSVFKDCIITEKVIVFRWKSDTFTFFPASEERTKDICEALKEMDLIENIYVCKLQTK